MLVARITRNLYSEMESNATSRRQIRNLIWDDMLESGVFLVNQQDEKSNIERFQPFHPSVSEIKNAH